MLNTGLFDKMLIKVARKEKMDWTNVVDAIVLYERVKAMICKKAKVSVEELENNLEFQKWEKFNSILKKY